MRLSELPFPALQQHGVAITTYFYKSLFLEHPGLPNIFSKANQRDRGQSANLAASILMYAAHIDHLDQRSGMVERIAHKHGSMEFQPEHYPTVGHHLLLAIRHALGEAATEEIIAWGAVYRQFASIFIGCESQLHENGAAVSGGWRGFKPFVVQEKVRESSTITSFYLEPADAKLFPHFHPGYTLVSS